MTLQVSRRSERKRDPIKTKEKLLESGIELFNNPGYFFTDSNEIARKAGFAPGTFYQHFRNKNELFIEIYKNWLSKQLLLMEEGLKSAQNLSQFCEQMAVEMLPLFGEWKGFRNSVRALTATDQATRDFRRKSAEAIFDLIKKVSLHFKLSPLEMKQALPHLLCLESFLDAFAEGVLFSYGYSEEEVKARMVKILSSLFGLS